MNLEFLDDKCVRYELVGSRVTCNPAPTDTDQDVLVLTTLELYLDKLWPHLEKDQFEAGGSDVGDRADYLATADMSFQSFTLGDLNLIITFDQRFYDRFMAATDVAKALNLLNKSDRVMLFQAVLYGNSPVPEIPPIPEVIPPIPDYVRPWWVTAEKRGSGCVEALNEEAAKTIGSEVLGAEIIACEKLPYPADPRLNAYDGNPHGICPSFCYAPTFCKGFGSCPQSPSCTE